MNVGDSVKALVGYRGVVKGCVYPIVCMGRGDDDTLWVEVKIDNSPQAYTLCEDEYELVGVKTSDPINLKGATKVKLKSLNEIAKDPDIIVKDNGSFYSEKTGSAWIPNMTKRNLAGTTIKIHEISSPHYETHMRCFDEGYNYRIEPWMVEEVLERETDVKLDFKITCNDKEINPSTLSDASLLALIRGYHD